MICTKRRKEKSSSERLVENKCNWLAISWEKWFSCKEWEGEGSQFL